MNRRETTVSGWEIRSFRDKFAMPQRQLAKLLGVPQHRIVVWERDEKSVDERRAVVLRRMIDTADHLLARRANPNWNL
jgi:DNA-binding transcriptional regulator YiaG